MSWAATPAGRGVRASALAVIAVALAVAAHLAACGEPPSLPVTGCGVALAFRVCWGCSGRRMSLRRIAGLVTTVQAGLHLAFAMTARPTQVAASHHHAAVGPVDLSDGAAGIDLLPGGPRMALAHLCAALLLSWWLAAGERLLWRIARRTAAVARRAAVHLRRRLRPPAWRPLPTQTVRWCRPPTGRAHALAQLVHLVVRRGPPDPAPA
ncbi:hypothetical protein [Parafrankia sp. FMc2]|uniref:hypothetical protein n=1 Tax=Parafrankia sp. FMc2 TaxID=3233196 RepID=UPI0034D4F89F